MYGTRNKNVKNYDVGSIRVHLPLRNFIHELPLFHFSDLYGTIGISLIYNSLLHDGTNPFNINTGYKINLQKRIFFEDNQLYVQDSYGNIEQAYGTNNIYTLNDESKRVRKITDGLYTIEYPDFTKEIYDSNGMINSIYDKY